MTVTTAAAPQLDRVGIVRGDSESGYAYGIGYLRAFVTVLVVVHHALFAYNPAAAPPGSSLLDVPRSWRAFPVVDVARTDAALLFNSFTDTFFMSLMFFISGLFVWRSLERKGAGAFLRDRALRLGLPFAVAACVIAPIAFYPAYLMTAPRPSVGDYTRQWLALGEWPAGPAWFVWVLLAFNGIAAAGFLAAPSRTMVLAGGLRRVLRRPAAFVLLLIVLSAAVYMPAALTVGAGHWMTFGPFAVQTSRVLHYAVYFAAGILVGACGLAAGPLGGDGQLAARWPIWVAAAGAAFAVFVLVHGVVPERHGAARVLAALAFPVSCGFSAFAFTALFLRFADRPHRALDSLRENAYGIYLIHFPFSNWIQYLLLGAALPVVAKASLAFAVTLLASWLGAALLRQVPAVRRLV